MRGKKEQKLLPDNVQELLAMAKKAEDPAEKERCLLAAETLDGEDLGVQLELVLLGNLARRNPEKIDYAVIKCFLLHAFEHPEMHSEDEEKRLTEEIFHHPRLEKCVELAQNPQEFLKLYLSRLSRDYIHIFIEGQREHTGGWLGFQLPGKRIKSLSRPCADVIRNALLSPFMTREEQTLFVGVFYRECLSFLGNSVYLDELLGEAICALIC